ncbi:hypothetical protein LMG27177_04463 [Paraburkholderia fynbosensis]|uniref:Uncharacterized protein n=1 Tax=Paraburkholderia fynbosensis TaxID=1200993 RepID=A0A6J5GE39_9BURK|nr:hypothetical protein LMG27177_04463 [Paraburkholderia fynbosensis]
MPTRQAFCGTSICAVHDGNDVQLQCSAMARTALRPTLDHRRIPTESGSPRALSTPYSPSDPCARKRHTIPFSPPPVLYPGSARDVSTRISPASTNRRLLALGAARGAACGLASRCVSEWLTAAGMTLVCLIRPIRESNGLGVTAIALGTAVLLLVAHERLDGSTIRRAHAQHSKGSASWARNCIFFTPSFLVCYRRIFLLLT